VACLLRPAWEGWRSVTPLLLTSLLFMAFHMDFVQSLALAPTAFFLGWLRLMSGSIWPSIAAHFVNNSVAVIGILMMSGEPDLEMFEASPYVVVVSALIACAVSAGTWAFSRSREKAVVA
jgi:membrane protease YdiL (CAAX protease family)